jgi:hypothetical protein
MQMQAQHSSAHADPEIFTDGWDPQHWQQQQHKLVQQQQQQQQSLSAPMLPQLYRPALIPQSSHTTFAAAVAAAGAMQLFIRKLCAHFNS